MKFEQPLASHTNPTVTYPVAADAGHYNFIGWFADSAWTTMVTFTELDEATKQNYRDYYGVSTFVVIDKMPAHNFPLYAGYALKGWDCAVNPNGGTLTNPNQAGVFWLDYGQYFSSDLKQSITREGYIFQGWMVAEVPFKADGENLDLKSVYTDDNNHRFVGDYSNWTMTETPWEFSTPISGATALMAKWFYKETMSVVYDAGTGTNAPTDEGAYSDHASTVAFRAPTPPENKFFIGWDIQGTTDEEHLQPGATFEVNSEYAVDGVVTLVAVYNDYGSEEEIPVTHIDWYANNTQKGQYEVGKDDDGQPIMEEQLLHSTDTNLHLNQGTAIHSATEFSNPGYEFKGWAKLHKDGNNLVDHKGNTVAAADADMDYTLTSDNLYLKYEGGKFYAMYNGNWEETTEVAADENSPQDDMYAVWEKAYVYVYHTGTGKVDKIAMADADEGLDLYNYYSADDGYYYGGIYADYNKGAFAEDVIAAGNAGTTYSGGLYTEDYARSGRWSSKNALTNTTITLADDGTIDYTSKGDDTGDGIVFYIKEVKKDFFLKDYVAWVYNTADNTLQRMYPITNVDDSLYEEISITLIDNDTTDKEPVKLATTFGVVNGTDGSTKLASVTREMVSRQSGYNRGFLAVATIADLESSIIKAGHSYQIVPSWTTYDGVEVKVPAPRTMTVTALTADDGSISFTQ